MIAGIGVDLCSISRIKNALKSEHFRESIFSLQEIAYAESKGAQKFGSYASCFAAREAFIKASRLSLTSVMMGRNFELIRNDDGAPVIRLSGDLEERYPEGEAKIFVSLTHEGDYACAMVVIEKFNDEVVNNGDKDSGF
ncbi:MAG: holo-ACP synthase [Synergistaceae bacterium]|nr:holo-ACP synthase [Synergistaceae bacterium]